MQLYLGPVLAMLLECVEELLGLVLGPIGKVLRVLSSLLEGGRVDLTEPSPTGVMQFIVVVCLQRKALLDAGPLVDLGGPPWRCC